MLIVVLLALCIYADTQRVHKPRVNIVIDETLRSHNQNRVKCTWNFNQIGGNNDE